MISTINYLELKKILLKKFVNVKVMIQLRGILDTKIFIENTRIMINKHKLTIFNSEHDFSIEFMMMKNFKIEEKCHIELIYEDFTVILEL